MALVAIAPNHGRAEIGHVWFTPAVRSYFSLTRVMEERLNGYCGMLLYAGVPAAKFQAIAARRAGASCDFSQRRSVFSFTSKFCFVKLPKIDNL
ncbi:MAG: hypothetical protein V7K48_09425 [Nostoc sp.]|uniref:hypothetical protein n=1 Tax=Nostoc sp. TaxID=1180 RepID=UPI002FF74D6B